MIKITKNTLVDDLKKLSLQIESVEAQLEHEFNIQVKQVLRGKRTELYQKIDNLLDEMNTLQKNVDFFRQSS